MLHFLVTPFLSHREFLRGQLHDRMAQDLVLRNLSPATARNYLVYGRQFAAKPRHSVASEDASQPPSAAP
jgi:hypothetical protein